LALEQFECQFSSPSGRSARAQTSIIEDQSQDRDFDRHSPPLTSLRIIVRPEAATRLEHQSKEEELGLMKIRPLQDRILVKRIDEEDKTKGGIIIPDTAKEKPQEGKVVAVGNGRVAEDGTVRPLDVKKGDKVLFGKYGGTEVGVAGEEHLIIREDDILGIIE